VSIIGREMSRKCQRRGEAGNDLEIVCVGNQNAENSFLKLMTRRVGRNAQPLVERTSALHQRAFRLPDEMPPDMTAAPGRVQNGTEKDQGLWSHQSSHLRFGWREDFDRCDLSAQMCLRTVHLGAQDLAIHPCRQGAWRDSVGKPPVWSADRAFFISSRDHLRAARSCRAIRCARLGHEFQNCFLAGSARPEQTVTHRSR
jgi:hypothetical protein